MCTIAVHVFGEIFSPDYIRKCIDPKFKIGYRRVNGKRSWTKRITARMSSIDRNMEQSLVEGTHSTRD